MKLETANRKRTTTEALKATQELIDSLNEQGFYEDVATVKSQSFASICQWEHESSIFRIKDGKLEILSVGTDGYYSIELSLYSRINFPGMIERLWEVIRDYNTLCEEKDKQIEIFLSFCDNYLKG